MTSESAVVRPSGSEKATILHVMYCEDGHAVLDLVAYFNFYQFRDEFSRRQTDDIFSQEIGFDILCKLSPKETICMKC